MIITVRISSLFVKTRKIKVKYQRCNTCFIRKRNMYVLQEEAVFGENAAFSAFCIYSVILSNTEMENKTVPRKLKNPLKTLSFFSDKYN